MRSVETLKTISQTPRIRGWAVNGTPWKPWVSFARNQGLPIFSQVSLWVTCLAGVSSRFALVSRYTVARVWRASRRVVSKGWDFEPWTSLADAIWQGLWAQPGFSETQTVCRESKEDNPCRGTRIRPGRGGPLF